MRLSALLLRPSASYWNTFLCVLGTGLLLSACGSDTANKRLLAPGDTLVVVGTLMDAQCFAQKKEELGLETAMAQAGTFDCSGQFVEQGAPAALVEENAHPEEATWILVAVPQMMRTHMAERVRVTGQFRSKGVLVPSRIDRDDGSDTWPRIF